MDLKNKISKITDQYNQTYHMGIKCTPEEALEANFNAYVENSKDGKYHTRFKSRKSEQLHIAQYVLIAQKENIDKNKKGRFLKRGVVIAKFNKSSYLIRIEDGKLTKKNIRELKGV